MQNSYISIHYFFVNVPAVSWYSLVTSGASAILKVMIWLNWARACGEKLFKYCTEIHIESPMCLARVSMLPSKLLFDWIFIAPKISSKMNNAGINGSLAYFRSICSWYSVSYIILRFASKESVKNWVSLSNSWSLVDLAVIESINLSYAESSLLAVVENT